jgi:hypothetical protein
VRGRGERSTRRWVGVCDRLLVSRECINIMRRLEIPREQARRRMLRISHTFEISTSGFGFYVPSRIIDQD